MQPSLKYPCSRQCEPTLRSSIWRRSRPYGVHFFRRRCHRHIIRCSPIALRFRFRFGTHNATEHSFCQFLFPAWCSGCSGGRPRRSTHRMLAFAVQRCYCFNSSNHLARSQGFICRHGSREICGAVVVTSAHSVGNEDLDEHSFGQAIQTTLKPVPTRDPFELTLPSGYLTNIHYERVRSPYRIGDVRESRWRCEYVCSMSRGIRWGQVVRLSESLIGIGGFSATAASFVGAQKPSLLHAYCFVHMPASNQYRRV